MLCKNCGEKLKQKNIKEEFAVCKKCGYKSVLNEKNTVTINLSDVKETASESTILKNDSAMSGESDGKAVQSLKKWIFVLFVINIITILSNIAMMIIYTIK